VFSEFSEENKIIKAAFSPHCRVSMVIGRSDTGKTTFIERLADHLSQKTEVGIVDLDMGQSHIGPPSTIAWGRMKGGFKSWQDIKVKDFYFTGALSPLGSLLPAVTGAKLITEKALGLCNKIIIDTTGLINEPDGRVLKQFKVDLLKPDIIIALERSGELENILKSFTFYKIPKVLRIPVLKRTGTKSTALRSEHRMNQFRTYFKNAEEMTVSLENIGIRFTRGPVRFNNVELKNRIISFRDEKNMDMALGIVKEVHARKKTLVVHSPLNKNRKIASIVIGTVQIDW
jgi:polynucleotide 5'-hydroxyl-kinase GRC3/NOL9